MEFLCTFDSNDLCFFGGICSFPQNGTTDQVCQCPQGFTHDFTIFHDPNCALPSNALLIFFIEYTVLASILFAFLIRERTKKGKNLRKLINFLILCTLFSIAFALSLWLEHGLFEASLTMLCLFIWAYLRTVVEVTRLFFTSASSIIRNRQTGSIYQKALIRSAALLEVVLIGMVIAMIIICRTERFNVAFSACMLVLAGFNIVLISFIIRATESLRGFATKEIGRLPSGNEILSDKWTDLIRRVTLLRLAIFVYSIVFVLGLSALPIIHFVIGSAPFAWVFLFASVHTTSLCLAAIFFFVHQPLSMRNSFFAIGENLDSEEVTAYRSMFGVRTPIIKGRLHLSVGRLLSSKPPTTNHQTNIETYESSAANMVPADIAEEPREEPPW